MWWLAAIGLSQISIALMAEVQTMGSMILRAKNGKRGLCKSPGSQLFNPEQDIICFMPSVLGIWGTVDTVLYMRHNRFWAFSLHKVMLL